MKKWFLLLFGLLFVGGIAQAQEGAGTDAVAVLFFSPSCPHCEAYIQNELPLLQDEFGARLSVYMIDVSTERGSYLVGYSFAHYDIPQNEWGVPMMLIGDHILQGAVEIPSNASPLIAAGLADGGIGLPPIPILRETLGELIINASVATTASAATLTLNEKLARDPVANGLAVLVLFASIMSLALIAFRPTIGRISQLIGSGCVVAAIGLVALLFVQTRQDMLALALAMVAFILLISTLIIGIIARQTRILTPFIALSGLGVAFYLAMVELTQDAAACGLVGDCNAVQQSPYAYLLGIPIGVIGVVGYLAILGAYLAMQQGLRYADTILSGFLIVGVAFSIYLTFLEPFVIGATCLWCLLNATLMLTLLWFNQPEEQISDAAQGRDFVPIPA